MRLFPLALLLIALTSPAFAQAGERGAGLLINEIRIDQPSADDDEYVEFINLTSTPFSLDGYTYLVLGDGAGGSGVVESITRFGSGDVVPANGVFLVAEDGDTFGAVADVTTAALGFENSDNVTHLLVNGFTGADQDDLDTDDDGTLDVTPWMFVLDAVGLIESVGSGDLTYAGAFGGSDVGPSGTFVPAHVFRDPVTLAWTIGEFDPSLSNDTPGAANTPPVTTTEVFFAAASGTANEGDGSVTLTVSISNPAPGAATTADVALTSGDPADLGLYTTQPVTFPAGSSADQTVTVTITDDGDAESVESFTFTLQNVAGGDLASAGSPDTFDLSLADNDTPIGSFDIVINEILADPNSSGGSNFDTDGDGSAETDDEFVELYNDSASPVDISGWELYDGFAPSTPPASPRHVFASGTMLGAADFVTVVSGWDPGTTPSGVVTASSGSLSLNNGGDAVFLYNPSTGQYVAARYNGNTATFPGPAGSSVADEDFGSDTDGESLQRFPDGAANVTTGVPTPIAANVPVELIAFDVTLDGATARLAWTTASETNNSGFEVQMRSGPGAYTALSFVDGTGTTTEAQSYTFRTDALAPGSYTFRLKQIDFDGAFEYSPEVEATVALAEAFALSAVYPNPFGPADLARVSLTVQQAQPVSVMLYDALGRRVATLHDGPLDASTPVELVLEGQALASGVYILRAQGDAFAATQRVVVVR